MIKTDNKLPSWISKQANFGPNVLVDGELTNENAYRFLLTACCPLLFDSYAIVLNPFWINWKAKELVDSGFKLQEEQLDESDFKRLSWKQFFKIHGKDFDLKTANQTQFDIMKQIQLNEWPPYLWFPGEGNCETEDLNFILNQLKKFYGNTLVNYYYCLLKTKKLDNEIIYHGNLSEFDKLKNQNDISENPTAIYPNEKEWCIVTDYDLSFTYIGGKKEFIESITSNNNFDIFRIEPIFKEKTDENTSH